MMATQPVPKRVPPDDGSFFSELYAEHREPLLQLLYRLTGDWSSAEDALQQAFARVYADRAKFDWSQPARNLLVTVALNSARREFRDRRREERGIPEIAAPPERDRSARLELMFRELPAEERAVLVLFYYGRFSYLEIATMLSMPLGTVKWKMHDAMKRLRPRLEALADEL